MRCKLINQRLKDCFIKYLLLLKEVALNELGQTEPKPDLPEYSEVYLCSEVWKLPSNPTVIFHRVPRLPLLQNNVRFNEFLQQQITIEGQFNLERLWVHADRSPFE